MMLFTPLSADQSERAISGDGFPDDTLYFVDKPDPDEATDDAVWVVIEVPDEEAPPFEVEGLPYYREFAIPGVRASQYPARRADVG